MANVINFLAQRLPRVLGIDVAESAIVLARREWKDIENLEFRVANAVDSSVAEAIHDELGDMNIYMRGVYHVIQQADRPSFAANLATFSKGDEARWFPEASWKVVDSGSTVIRTLPLPDGKAGEVPAYYVMAQTRA